jgi:hypothetical protein
MGGEFLLRGYGVLVKNGCRKTGLGVKQVRLKQANHKGAMARSQ